MLGKFSLLDKVYSRAKNLSDLFQGPNSSLKREIQKSNPLRVVVGASGLKDLGWVGTDQFQLNLLNPKDWDELFKQRKIDALLAEHVWEHLTLQEGEAAFKNCFKYLKAGGYLRIAVPDGNHPDPDYINWVKVGGVGPGSDDHKVLYTVDQLESSLVRSGFQVRRLEYFDSNGQFHQNPWSKDQGLIHRSKDFDERNSNGQLKYTSIIVDAIKPNHS